MAEKLGIHKRPLYEWREQFLYLAVVLDAYSRRVVGWAGLPLVLGLISVGYIRTNKASTPDATAQPNSGSRYFQSVHKP